MKVAMEQFQQQLNAQSFFRQGQDGKGWGHRKAVK
jgi:hypothetical protein